MAHAKRATAVRFAIQPDLEKGLKRGKATSKIMVLISALLRVLIMEQDLAAVRQACLCRFTKPREPKQQRRKRLLQAPGTAMEMKRSQMSPKQDHGQIGCGDISMK